MSYGNPGVHRPSPRISLADIAAQPGGIEALHRRIHELRSSGVEFAAKAIEREMADLALSRDMPIPPIPRGAADPARE